MHADKFRLCPYVNPNYRNTGREYDAGREGLRRVGLDGIRTRVGAEGRARAGAGAEGIVERAAVATGNLMGADRTVSDGAGTVGAAVATGKLLDAAGRIVDD